MWYARYYSRKINRYSTTSTSEAAYIIGGYHTKEIIAEYKNDAWSQLGSLNKGRHAHASISLGDETMIIGGFSSDYRWVYDLFEDWTFFQCSWNWDLELDKWKSQRSQSNSTKWSVRLWNRPVLGSFRFLYRMNSYD